MKKIFLFAAAMLAAFTMNAQTIEIDGDNADWADVPMLTEPGVSPVVKMIVPQTGATLPDGAAYCLMVAGEHEQILAGYPVIYTDADMSNATGTAPWICCSYEPPIMIRYSRPILLSNDWRDAIDCVL